MTNRFNVVFGAWFFVLMFLLRRSLQHSNSRAAPRHRPVASLWRARLSIDSRFNIAESRYRLIEEPSPDNV